MKKVIVLVALIMLVAVPVFAGVSAGGPHNTAGAKVDAPNLIRFTDNLTLGLEGGKDIATDVFYKAGEGVSYYEADRGYFAYAKITYTGSLFSFNKNEE